VGIIAALVSIVTLAYLLKVQKHAFYGKKGSAKVLEKVPFAMKTAMIILAALCLISSALMIPSIRKNYLNPIVDTVMGKTSYVDKIEPYLDNGSVK